MNKNQKVRVADKTLYGHHQGKAAYFQFYGASPLGDVAILSCEPSQNGLIEGYWIVVGRNEITRVD